MIFIQPVSTVSLSGYLLGEVILRERLGHLCDDRIERRCLVECEEFSGYVGFDLRGKTLFLRSTDYYLLPSTWD
jgi:hypothetical protein